eukprot:CAMPEP_0197854182 /NCGR_PEP_ID=MMETSP1438-20131217/24176_1 /TAXON_ID=1461541 /ORGANISM="Pterosperma sp., Strain CCMP1384" /LENGTH=43 /DNA_ID= /DNA_START= /DNA_END= /DNA_ORIENTATION=
MSAVLGINRQGARDPGLCRLAEVGLEEWGGEGGVGWERDGLRG